jgi:FkbM family methyltransferase
MPLASDGSLVQDRSQENVFYRPHVAIEHRMLSALVAEQALATAPLTVGDVGVRNGFDSLWDAFGAQCLQVGFEPDEQECARLEEAFRSRREAAVPRQRLERLALWERPGPRALYLMQDPTVASCYRPNLAYFRRFPDPSPMELVRTLEVDATTLDAYARAHATAFDVLKLDVQGAELPVLKGAEHQLRESLLAVITEVEFVELYEGQPLFADIDVFLRQRGFRLFDLDIRRWRRKPLGPDFERLRVGQAVWADALYLRDVVEAGLPAAEPRVALLKLAAVAERLSLPDVAMEALEFGAGQGWLEASEASRLAGLLAADRITRHRDRNRPSWPAQSP